MRNTNPCIKTNRWIRLGAALLCAALLAGCGGGDDGGGPLPTPAGTPTQEASATASPQPGGTMTVSIPQGATLGNPLTVTSREMSSLYGLMFESLLDVDDSGAPAPGLAETWQGSDDGLTWTFTLRSGVTWQGTGTALAASDVEFTFDQIIALGKGDGKPWGFVTDYVKSCKAGDGGTVIVELKQPFYGALQALTFPVLPAGVGYENGEAPEMPIGTGPYKAAAQKEGEIDLTQNPDWWKKPPYLKDIKAVSFPDNATAVSTLALSGQLDAVQTDDLTVTQYRDSGDANVYEYPTRYFEYMAINFSSPDLQDKRIRQAVAYAIDRLEIVSYTYVNHAAVTDTPIPPDSWLYDGKVLNYNVNVEEARRLIMLAGWKDQDPAGGDGIWDTSPDGVKRTLSLTVLANQDENNTIRSDAAVLIVSQLAKAGIKAELKTASWDDYKTLIGEKRFDLALCGTYLSPVPDYRPLMGTGGALNVGGYQDGDMDTLLDGVLNSPDSATLKVKMGELQSKIIDDLPIICLYFRYHSLLTSLDLKSVTGSISGAREDDAFARISQWYKDQ